MKKGLNISMGVLSLVGIVAIVWAIVGFVSHQFGGYATSSGVYDYDLSMDDEGMAEPGLQTFGLNVVAPSAKMMRTGGIAEESLVPMEDTDLEQERLIIKTGSMAMVVENVRGSMNTISEYAQNSGGFVVSSNIYKSGVSPYGEVVVRVPAEKFDEATEQIKTMGEVTSQSMNGQDVTEEYVDLDAQLGNLHATEEQFLTIMKKATEITDILAVQKELSRVRSDIERIEGRMKYLRESADLSTLTVHLSTDPDVLPVLDEDERWKPFAVVKNSARSLLVVAQWVADGIIFFVVFIPLWLMIGLGIWGIVRFVKRRGRKMDM